MTVAAVDSRDGVASDGEIGRGERRQTATQGAIAKRCGSVKKHHVAGGGGGRDCECKCDRLLRGRRIETGVKVLAVEEQSGSPTLTKKGM